MKNSILSSMLFVFITYGLFAQKSDNRLTIGVTAGLVENVSDETIDLDQYQGFDTDYDQTNYRIGVTFDYKAGEKTSLQTAITYANMDFTATYYCEVCDFEVPPTAQIIDYKIIEVPLMVRYYFLQNRLKPFASGGATNHFLTDTDAALNGYSLSATVGGGVEYALTDILTLQATVVYDQGITNIFKQSDYKLQTLGFGVGMLYSL